MPENTQPPENRLADFQRQYIDPVKDEWRESGRDPENPYPTATDTSTPEPKSFLSPDMSKALSAGKWGAAAGAGLGALRAALSPQENKHYLRDTLAGALIGGGLGAGGSYFAGDPFRRGGIGGKAFEAAKGTLMEGAADPNASVSELGGRAALAMVASGLSGEGEFGPKQQSALLRQFELAQVPTSEGWRKRVELSDHVSQLLQTRPYEALESLQTLQVVAPDPTTKALAGRAIADIRSGRDDPNTRNALALIGKSLGERAKFYQRGTHSIDALNIMKELRASGQMSGEDVAKNLGLLTGRFGSSSEQAQEQRQLLQQAIANPVRTAPGSPYPSLQNVSPSVAALARKAMR